MKETWDSEIERANQLAAERPESNELLKFYAELLRSQKNIYQYLRTRKKWIPSGDLKQDLPMLEPVMSNLLEAVEVNGSDTLASYARSLLNARASELEEMLLEHWLAPLDEHFFAKAFLQPYARWLSEIGVKPLGRNLRHSENRCPFCEGKPQVAVLLIKESSSESGGRDLVCAMCLTSWSFRRVVCVACGEENPAKIGYFHTPHYDHIRIEACDSCKYYIKAVDLTRYGFAVPIVDEVAAAPLDLWARGHGYTKIEMNLVGL